MRASTVRRAFAIAIITAMSHDRWHAGTHAQTINHSTITKPTTATAVPPTSLPVLIKRILRIVA